MRVLLYLCLLVCVGCSKEKSAYESVIFFVEGVVPDKYTPLGLERPDTRLATSIKWDKDIVYKCNGIVHKHKNMSLLDYVKIGSKSYLYVSVGGVKGLVAFSDIVKYGDSRKIVSYYVKKVNKVKADRLYRHNVTRYEKRVSKVNFNYRVALKKKFRGYTLYTFRGRGNHYSGSAKVYDNGKMIGSSNLSSVSGIELSRDRSISLYLGQGGKYFFSKKTAIESYF